MGGRLPALRGRYVRAFLPSHGTEAGVVAAPPGGPAAEGGEENGEGAGKDVEERARGAAHASSREAVLDVAAVPSGLAVALAALAVELSARHGVSSVRIAERAAAAAPAAACPALECITVDVASGTVRADRRHITVRAGAVEAFRFWSLPSCH
jgi:hypothetical protein